MPLVIDFHRRGSAAYPDFTKPAADDVRYLDCWVNHKTGTVFCVGEALGSTPSTTERK